MLGGVIPEDARTLQVGETGIDERTEIENPSFVELLLYSISFSPLVASVALLFVFFDAATTAASSAARLRPTSTVDAAMSSRA
jgi:hypothetical protein